MNESKLCTHHIHKQRKRKQKAKVKDNRINNMDQLLSTCSLGLGMNGMGG